MNYVCTDCGKYFDTPEHEEIDKCSFWGAPCSETIKVCPKCLSPRIMSLVKRKGNAFTPIQLPKEVKK